MKKIIFAILLAGAAMGLTSCLGDGAEDQYKEWRKANNDWFVNQSMLVDENGQLFYTPVGAPWDPNARVFVHWFNDRNLTKDNLQPYYTSTIDVKYKGQLYDGTPFDSSFVSTSPADSVRRMALNNTIEGWGIAITQMHVGDSCRILINYPQGYGTYSVNSLIKPFSVLQFDVKLVDIYAYETGKK